jgi:hypothetical protein
MNIRRPDIRCPAMKFGAIVRFRCLPAVLALMAAAIVWSPAGAFSGDALNLEHIYLQMNRSPARENAAAELVEKLHDFIGNVSNPKIPAALAPAVRYCGVDVCQKFHRRPGRNTRFTSICAPSYDLH